MKRFFSLVTLWTLCIVLSSPSATLAVALYIKDSGQIMVRQDELDSDTEGWKLVKSGGVLFLNLSDLQQQIAPSNAKKGDESLLRRAIYNSGLVVEAGVVYDPDFNQSDREREIVIGLTIDNLKGKNEVQVSSDEFFLVDDTGESYSFERCHDEHAKEHAKDFDRHSIGAGETGDGGICVSIPGRMDIRRLKLRFNDGSGEEIWMRLRK